MSMMDSSRNYRYAKLSRVHGEKKEKTQKMQSTQRANEKRKRDFWEMKA